MMDVTLHPTPRRREVILEQIRHVGLSLRREALVVAVVLGIGTVVVIGDILGGGPGLDSNETFPTALVAFLLPFLVWRNDKRFRPSFLWTLPVDRRQLALAKVFAGGVWLAAAVALFVIWVFMLGLPGRVPTAHTVERIPFIATIAMYLFGSSIVLGLRHPLRWMFGAAGLFFLIGGVSQKLEHLYGVRTLLGSSRLYSAVDDAAGFWQTLPVFAQWAISAFLLIGAGLALLWAAASRHVERRRH